MTSNTTRASTGTLTSGSDYLIAVLLGVAGFVTVGTWATGQLAGLLFEFAWPQVPFGEALSIAMKLPGHFSDPRQAWPTAAQEDLPGPIGFFIAAIMVTTMLITIGVYAARWLGRSRQVRGYASRTQLAATLSEKAALAKAARLRPGLSEGGRLGSSSARPRLTDVAVLLGRAHPSGMRLAASIENSVAVFAAPRQGKTSQVIIPWLTDWPGPAVVTSVRGDVLENTLTLRANTGPVAVVDLTGEGWPCPLSWSPLSGCEDFDKARTRADVMVQIGKSGSSDSTNAGFFGLTATNLLAAWMHTAAVTGRTMTDVLRWTLAEGDDEPIRLLAASPNAHEGVAAMLDTIYSSPTETRSNMWATVMTAMAPLISRNAQAVFCPAAGKSFDIEEFLRQRGTVYLMVSEKDAADLAPLLSAFVDEIVSVAKRLADAAGGRLDPPLGLFLDEVANVVPLPQLPALMSYAGGSGIFVVAVFQSLAQARQRWGHDGADMLWGAATIKLALGGLSGDELEDLSRLAGEYRETVTAVQHSPHGATVSPSLTDRRTISPDEIRTLDERLREALVIHATTPAVKTRMTRHYEGPDARRYAEAVTTARQLRQHRQPVTTTPSAAEQSGEQE